MLRLARSLGLAVALFALAPGGASANVTLDPIGSFDKPMYVTSAPEDEERIFIVEREGQVLELSGGSATLYADLGAYVSCCTSERGLLSIALDPYDFHSTGRIYAAYTGNEAAGGAVGDIHVDSFVPTGAGGGEVDREPIIAIGHSKAANHNGGQIQFGPESNFNGHLYISTGDGGGGGDPDGNGQNLTSLLGKILRIDPHPGATPPYTTVGGGRSFEAPAPREIWAAGLRNPWRFSFDSLTGAMLIGDVGQGLREEVNWVEPRPMDEEHPITGGDNFGWNCREGFIAYPSAPESCEGATGFTDPIFDYAHGPEASGKPNRCSITGGYVVRDESLGDLYGRYVYADYCAGEVHSLALPPGGVGLATTATRGSASPNPTSFGEDACGRIYVASGGGNVYRLVGDVPADCESQEPPGEEPPKEEPEEEPKPFVPPPGDVLDVAPLTTVAATMADLRLSAARRGGRLHVRVRVGPCESWRGRSVQLNRGGRRIDSRLLDGDCEVPSSKRPSEGGLRSGRWSSRRAERSSAPSGTYSRASAARCGRSRWRSPSRSGRPPASSSARGGAARQ